MRRKQKSWKNRIAVALLVVLIGGGIFLIHEYFSSPSGTTSTNLLSYQSADFGISFKYKTGEDGYRVMDTSKVPPATLRLVRTKDYAMIENPPEGGEGPVGMIMQAFPNPGKVETLKGAQTHQESNFNLKTTNPVSIRVDGVEGIKYSWTGLYEGDTVVISRGNKLYVFSVTYMEKKDSLREDFEELLQSVKFI